MVASSGQGTNVAPATNAGSTGLSWAPIPAWQISSLQQLASQGKLYGVPPQVLAVIVSAESGGEVGGAGINSSGYGGYFGLGTGNYPGGSVTSAQLSTNSPDSFTAQAKVAASAFASYLQKAGGNPVVAEQIYQTGSASGTPSEGAKLMSQYVGGTIINPGSVPAAGSSGSSNSTSACTPVISLPSVLGAGGGSLLNSCQLKELGGLLLVGVGGVVLLVGVAVIVGASKVGGSIGGIAQAVPGPVGTTARLAGGQGKQVGAERRSRATSAQRQSDALERTAARGQESRARDATKHSRVDETPF